MSKADNEDPSSSSPPSSASLPLQASHENEILPLSKFPSLLVFDTSIEYPALIVPVRRTAELRKTLSTVLLHLPKIKNVYANDADASTRKLVLNGDEALKDERVQALLSEGSDCHKSSHTIPFTYADRTVDEVLRQLLPSSISELPSAFEVVGSIAHLNLRDEVLPFKYIVGKVLLDKNQPRIQTVVNKLGSIANEYRTFGMEVIAGVDDNDWSLVKVKEEGCEFTLDFQQVYWNSRLGGEHKRLVELIRKDAQQRSDKTVVVADLMAGVGPFAVPLTACLSSKSKKKSKQKSSNNNHDNNDSNTNTNPKIIVHANDLNPASYKYLKINGQNNKCPKDRLYCYNMDARGFCHMLQQQNPTTNDATETTTTAPVEFHHVIMNLPATAPEFLDAFRGFTNTILPRIHVYCFAPKKPQENSKGDAAATDSTNNNDENTGAVDEIDAAVIERCSLALGCPLDVTKHHVSVRIVRDVSPKKNMVCVSFVLPEEIRGLTRIDIAKREEQSADKVDEGDNNQAKGNAAATDDNNPGEPKQKRTKTSS